MSPLRLDAGATFFEGQSISLLAILEAERLKYRDDILFLLRGVHEWLGDEFLPCRDAEPELPSLRSEFRKRSKNLMGGALAQFNKLKGTTYQGIVLEQSGPVAKNVVNILLEELAGRFVDTLKTEDDEVFQRMVLTVDAQEMIDRMMYPELDGMFDDEKGERAADYKTDYERREDHEEEVVGQMKVNISTYLRGLVWG